MSDYYVGLISGTSVDSVDAVLAEIDEDRCEVLATHSQPYPEAVRDDLQQIIQNPGTLNVDDLGELDTEAAQVFAEAALTLLESAGIHPAKVRAIGSHGQTVRHCPDGESPFSIQIADPNRIAAETGITTIADFRRRDMALGGQGAPLVPGFHHCMFYSPDEHRVVLNIGGIANITVLSAEGEVFGFDTGPGNSLMDRWSRRHIDQDFDRDGQWARQGRPIPELLARFLADRYFRRVPPKSTGRERFNMRWLEQFLSELDPSPDKTDVQASLLELTARSIADAIERHAPDGRRILVCGGGIHNPVLMERLIDLLAGRAVESTADHGIDPDWVEGAAFAWLAARTVHGQPGNLPAVTGAREAAVLGAIFPGRARKISI